MRRFNRGAAIFFLVIILVALLSVRWVHQRVEGHYQEQLAGIAAYTLDDWLNVLRLEEILGDPPVTPVPVEEFIRTQTPEPGI